MKLITVFVLLALCLGLFAGCGEEAPAVTTTAPVETTLSWAEKDAIDKAAIATNSSALAIALTDLGVNEDDVVVHTIGSDENRVVEIFLEYQGVMYCYQVDTENGTVLSKEQV